MRMSTKQVRIPESAHGVLSRIAADQGRSHGAVIERALAVYEAHCKEWEAWRCNQEIRRLARLDRPATPAATAEVAP